MLSQDDVGTGKAPGDPAVAQDWLRARWLAVLAGILSGLAAFGIGEATYDRIAAKKIMLNTMGTVAPAVTGANLSVAVVRNGAVACGVLGLCLGGILGIAGGLSGRSRSATVKAGVLGSTVGAILPASAALALLQSFANARLAHSITTS